MVRRRTEFASGINGHSTVKNWLPDLGNVRFGSPAGIPQCRADARITFNSGHYMAPRNFVRPR